MNFLLRILRDPAAEPAGGRTAVVEPPVASTAVAGDPTKAASASTTVNVSDPQKDTPPAFVIPEAYKDKPWAKGVDSLEKLWAMNDGAQNLIGKNRIALPGENATPEEINAFYEALGRPKEAKEYVFKTNEGTDPNFLPKVQAAMHKHGLTAKQAAGLWDDVNTALSEFAKEKGIADQKLNTDFTKLATDSFGAERDAVLSRGKDLIKELTSANMKPYVDTLSNESLVVLADILRNVDRKYIRPDGPGRQPTMSSETPDQLRGKARMLMEKQNSLNPMSTEYQTLQQQIDQIYNTLRQAAK
ncbi:MAG: hypothetical protein KGI08_02545 [Thaumarchaeota archaeon]|nr:hypothetical protein [Nitrososphaerota archaeon]